MIDDNPFVEPAKKFPDSIHASDQKRLTTEIDAVVRAEVLPAFQDFADFVSKDYAPHGRSTIGLSSLPDGARRYQQAIKEQTSTDMTAAEIHALGLREVARLTGLLIDLARKQGYTDLAGFRAALNSDPKYIPQSADQVVEDFRKYVTQMQSTLSELFNAYPIAALTVEAVPASEPGNAHTISVAHRMARDRRELWLRPQTMRRDGCLATKLLRTTKVFPVIICKSRCSSN